MIAENTMRKTRKLKLSSDVSVNELDGWQHRNNWLCARQSKALWITIKTWKLVKKNM